MTAKWFASRTDGEDADAAAADDVDADDDD